ncbi:MAG TPA: DUF695 domain-containing protein [Alphaproteobacteria bacterium]|nr:DUF695 domain-containing protein [Alphaproteobacteria bacterium]
MSEWIPYATSDAPSLEVSIDVDFDGDDDFVTSHPYLIRISITGFATDGDGQPTEAAAEELFDLEQRLEAVCEEHDAESVCTISGSGKYEIYVYAAGAADTLKEALGGPSFSVEVSVERDDAWKAYERYILRGEELEDARDSDQVAQMDEAGEDLTQEFDVTFDCEVPEGSVGAARRALEAAGFDTPGETYDGVIPATRTMLVTVENLKAARTQIQRAIAPFDGTYDGWGIDPDEDQYEEDEDALEDDEN